MLLKCPYVDGSIFVLCYRHNTLLHIGVYSVSYLEFVNFKDFRID